MSLSASDLSNSCHSSCPSLDEASSGGSGFAKSSSREPGPRAAPFDPDDRIVLGDIHALLDWCARLGCTEDELRDAVRKAGPRVQGVKRELGKDLYTVPIVGHLLR